MATRRWSSKRMRIRFGLCSVAASIGCSLFPGGFLFQNHYPRFRGAPSWLLQGVTVPKDVLRWGIRAYTYDHIHLRSRDPMATAQYFSKMFNAKIIESIQSDGQPRIDLDVSGLIIGFIAGADDTVPPEGPVGLHLGLDHFGFRVDDLASAVPSRAKGERRGVCGGTPRFSAWSEDCLRAGAGRHPD